MLSIIPARPGDEHALSELRRRVWLTTYRGIYPDDMLDQFDFAFHDRRNRYWIDAPDWLVLFILVDDQQAGYMILHTGERFVIQSLYLLEAYRRKGYGSMVFGQAEAHARALGYGSMHLFCHPANEPALTFYHHMGGRVFDSDPGDEPWQASLHIIFPL